MATKIEKSEQEWRDQLTPEQYEVTRKAGTERAFTGPHLDEKREGMFRCVGCGTELFSSDTKFDSGTGWPSFTDPANLEHVELRPDNSHFMRRTEVVCKACDAHLGHVFDDGPGPERPALLHQRLRPDASPEKSGAGRERTANGGPRGSRDGAAAARRGS